jgi:uncharacterized RDD family membrane protein YckC
MVEAPAPAAVVITGPVPYAGIATRAVALAIDVALAQLIVLVGGATLALVSSLVGEFHFDTPGKLLAAAAWLAVDVTYFVVFWSSAGQTPGMRMLGLRVTTSGGEVMGLGKALIRVVGLGLAIIPLFAGFLPVLVDDRRRALQDFMAGTVVIYDLDRL